MNVEWVRHFWSQQRSDAPSRSAARQIEMLEPRRVIA